MTLLPLPWSGRKQNEEPSTHHLPSSFISLVGSIYLSLLLVCSIVASWTKLYVGVSRVNNGSQWLISGDFWPVYLHPWVLRRCFCLTASAQVNSRILQCRVMSRWRWVYRTFLSKLFFSFVLMGCCITWWKLIVCVWLIWYLCLSVSSGDWTVHTPCAVPGLPLRFDNASSVTLSIILSVLG